MSDADRMYAFVFKGLLAEQALDGAGRAQKAVSAWDPEIEAALSLTTLDEAKVANAKRMAVVYIAIAAFENSARKLVEKVLFDAHGSDWWLNKVSQKIRDKAEGRKTEEEKFKWHTPRGQAPLHYTDFGDLANIMRQNFQDFEPHVRSQDWVDNVFDVVERSRNVIMHSGELAPRDVERVGINLRDWTAQVGA